MLGGASDFLQRADTGRDISQQVPRQASRSIGKDGRSSWKHKKMKVESLAKTANFVGK